MKEAEIEVCPFCSAQMERGSVLGNQHLSGSIQWVVGEPTLAKNLFGSFMPGSEELAKIDKLFAGPYLRGSRCKSCRKVILDY